MREKRKLLYLDATCPLVSKVHREAEVHFAAGRHIILIGHAGHPEVIGTIGQLPPGAVTLVETSDDAEEVTLPSDRLAYITQTTLSIDDTDRHHRGAAPALPQDPRPAQGRHLLRHHQPPGGGEGDRAPVRPRAGDRRAQFLQLAAPGRSGARRRLPAARIWCSARRRSTGRWFEGVKTVGITAGASAPEVLVQEVIAAIRQRYLTTIDEISVTEETTHFKLPRALLTALTIDRLNGRLYRSPRQRAPRLHRRNTTSAR